jgi:hypothetical protein
MVMVVSEDQCGCSAASGYAGWGNRKVMVPAKQCRGAGSIVVERRIELLVNE